MKHRILRIPEIPGWRYDGLVPDGGEEAIYEAALAAYQRVQDTRRSEVAKRLLSRRLTPGTRNRALEREAPERHETRVQWARRVALDVCGGDAVRAYQLLVAELLSADMPEEPGESRGGLRYIEELRCLGSGRVGAGDFGAWQSAIIEAARRIGRHTHQRAADRHLRCVGLHLVEWCNGDSVEMSPDLRVRRALLWGQVRAQLAHDGLWATDTASASDNV